MMSVKKMTIVLCLSLIACGMIAAQDQNQKAFTVTVEAATDPLFIRSFFGDYAVRRPLLAIGDLPYMYQGEGTIKAFDSSSGFTSGKQGRVRFTYEDDLMGGLLELRQADENGYGWVNNNQYMRFGYWDWNLWAKLFNEHLRVAAGNTAQRGQISSYSNFDSFLKGNVGNLGVFYPIWRRTPRAGALVNNLNIKSTFPYTSGDVDFNMGFADFTSSDTLDLFYPAGMGSRQQLGFLADVIFSPVTVSVSAGGLFTSLSLPFKTPWNAGDSTRLSDYDSDYDPVGDTGMNFGFRIEGAKIAGMLNVSAVYKFAESTLNKITAKANDSLKYLLDETSGSHAFGVYATVTPIDGLGITAGWSALTQYWTNPFYKSYDLDDATNGTDHVAHWLSAYKEVRFPFYNGIDLRFNYTGVEKLTITFNNNISFASVQGADQTDDAFAIYANGWAYTDATGLNPGGGQNAENRSENYLGLYNALGVRYAINDTFSVTAQAANRLGIFTLNWEKDPRNSITDSLSVYAGVSYRINGRRELVRTLIRMGLACNMNNYSYHLTDKNSSVQRAGYIDFGIPLSLALTF